MAKCEKRRLDERLVEDGLARDLHHAGALVLAGEVVVGDQRCTSAGARIKDDVPVRLKGGKSWVSRGAHKLLTAINRFNLNFEGKVCLDVGASTGGFTEVMLHHGASRVYSVDVGYSILDWKLRNDPRVVVMERQNARYLTPDMFDTAPSFASSDASFISLRSLLPAMSDVTSEDAEAVVLVKPQFEVTRDKLDGGIVRNPAVHLEVLEGLKDFIARETEWTFREATWSGIKGPKGNIEYLFRMDKTGITAVCDLEKVVMESHERLNGK